MAKKSRRNRQDVVYSTDPNFQYNYEDENQEQDTLDPSKQKLKVYIDTKAKKKGKQATLISGFVGSEDNLKDLAKLLKTKCAVGGSVNASTRSCIHGSCSGIDNYVVDCSGRRQDSLLPRLSRGGWGQDDSRQDSNAGKN